MSQDPRLAKYAAMTAEQLDEAISALSREMMEFANINGTAARGAQERILEEMQLAHSCYSPEALKARAHLLKD
jgi:hypothetical protein